MAETATKNLEIGSVTFLRSVIVKVTGLVAVTALVVAMVVTYLNRNAAKDMAVKSVAASTVQISTFLSAGLAGAVRFKDTAELERASQEAIDTSKGKIVGVAVANAEGAILQTQGAGSEQLEALAQEAFETQETAQSADGLLAASPIRNKKGDFAGVVAVAGDTTTTLAIFTASGQRTMMITLAVLAATLAACSWVVIITFVRPLTSVRNAMVEIEHHRYDVEIDYLSRRDELGQIARQVDHFREKLGEAKANARMTLFQSSAFRGSSVPMIMVSKAGQIVGENKAWQSLLDKHERLFQTVWPDVEGNSVVQQDVSNLHTQLDGEGGSFSEPADMPFKTDFSIGGAKFSVAASAILDDDDAFSGAILEIQDVTERRLNSGLLDAIRLKQGILELDTTGDVRNISENVLDHYQCASEQIIGTNILTMSANGSDTMKDVWDKVLAGESVQQKIKRTTFTGQEIWLDAFVNPVLDHKGNVYRIIEISTDITEAMNQSAVDQEQKALDEENQQAVVGALRLALSNMAKGNLDQDITEEFAAEYEQLRMDFNATTTKLRDVIKDISDVSQSITDGAREISQGSDELSQRTENQAATLEQTAAALDQITNSVKTSAEGASNANEAVQGARTNAQEGGTIVIDAVSAMKEIENSSDKISQIIGVIDDIAFQTNLLALNAGVEAARAGEAGRGFAVVASEVRALAQRSSDAAREIKELISTSSQHVDNGVGLVGKTGDALNRIVESVEHISGLIADIATSTSEQSTGLAEINTGVVQLDDVTQQNAAMVEESTAASHAMRLEAEKLEELVSIFGVADPSRASRRAPTPQAKQVVNGAPVDPVAAPSIEQNVERWKDF